MKRTICIVTALCLGLTQVSFGQKAKSATSHSATAVVNRTLSVEAYESLLKQKTKSALLIDVRTPLEYGAGHLKGARNIDFRSADFAAQIGQLDRSKPVFVYCLSGGRSGSAAEKMKEMGFREVYNMDGGILKWKASNRPVEVSEATKPTAVAGMNMADFKKRVSAGGYVMVDFNATWCGPCRKLAPVLESIVAKKKDKLTLLKIDADANPELVQEKNISSIPYLELYLNGNLVWQHTGYIDEQSILSETNL